jgi:hypothetical protein
VSESARSPRGRGEEGRKREARKAREREREREREDATEKKVRVDSRLESKLGRVPFIGWTGK